MIGIKCDLKIVLKRLTSRPRIIGRYNFNMKKKKKNHLKIVNDRHEVWFKDSGQNVEQATWNSWKLKF